MVGVLQHELHTKNLYSSACSNYSRKLGKLKRKNEYLHEGFICHEITPGGKWGVSDIWITICNLYLSASSKYECKFGNIYKKIEDLKAQFINEDLKALFVCHETPWGDFLTYELPIDINI